MNEYAALAGVRVGCVQYLNSKPLIAAYPGEVTFGHPSELARGLAAGELDAALVPIFEALGPRPYVAVDGVAIACDGPVYSVFLAHRGALADVQTIALDPASLTSAHLVQVLLREFHGLFPSCARADQLGEEPDAELLIGNQAIEYRRHASAGMQFLDLGAEWLRCTGLPFVFAVWVLRADLPQAPAVAEAFRALQREGSKLIPQIAARETGIGPALAQRYLTEYIRFDLAERQKQAVELFRSLLHKHGFLESLGKPLRYL